MQQVFQNTHIRLRAECTTTLCLALQATHQDEAAPICFAYLESLNTDGPRLNEMGSILFGDALLWADCAQPHELAAYVNAGLAALDKKALGLATRKKVFFNIWKSFPEAERRAFQRHVVEVA